MLIIIDKYVSTLGLEGLFYEFGRLIFMVAFQSLITEAKNALKHASFKQTSAGKF